MSEIPLQNSNFKLDTSGVAAFFGGVEAISAISTVNIFKGRGRRWTGWYNSPGSYPVARKFGQLANSRFWDGLFPGVNVDPTALFGLDGDDGPQFVGAESGSHIQDTGQIGSLLLKECQARTPDELSEGGKVGAETKRSPVSVTIADLKATDNYALDATLPRDWTPFVACVPILSSTAACIICGFYRDWYSFSMILLGMSSNGLSCLAFGSARFEFHHPKPAPGCPRGDGVLFSHAGAEVAVLLGEEEAVNSITRGKFVLQFPGQPEYRNVGLAAMLLTTQALLQLLLIPQGQFFGQIMFPSTLIISWTYNCYLSSLDKYQIQRRILMQKVLRAEASAWTKYPLGSRTEMVAFLLLILRPRDPKIILDKLLPNETETWGIWKRVVWDKIQSKGDFSFKEADYGGLVGKEKELLRTFYKDAEEAYKIYQAFEETQGSKFSGSEPV